MNFTDALGLVAGGLTTISLVPQLTKIWRTKSAKDVSLGMFIAFSTGVALWLVYGILVNQLPIIAANAVTLALASAILVMKVRYG